MDRALLESRPGPTAANWLRQPPHFTTEKTAAKPWQDATDTDPMFLHDVKHLKQKYPRLPDGSLSHFCVQQNSMAQKREMAGGTQRNGVTEDCPLWLSDSPAACPHVSDTAWLRLRTTPDGSLGPAPLPSPLLFHTDTYPPPSVFCPIRRHGCVDVPWCATFVCMNATWNLRYWGMCACFNICETNTI